jgi:hypothetical protein
MHMDKHWLDIFDLYLFYFIIFVWFRIPTGLLLLALSIYGDIIQNLSHFSKDA